MDAPGRQAGSFLPSVLVSICTVAGGLKLSAKFGSTDQLHIPYIIKVPLQVFLLVVNIPTHHTLPTKFPWNVFLSYIHLLN